MSILLEKIRRFFGLTAFDLEPLLNYLKNQRDAYNELTGLSSLNGIHCKYYNSRIEFYEKNILPINQRKLNKEQAIIYFLELLTSLRKQLYNNRSYVFTQGGDDVALTNAITRANMETCYAALALLSGIDYEKSMMDMASEYLLDNPLRNK